MEIRISEKDIISAAQRGSEAFVELFAGRTLDAIGGELNGETMQRLSADQITLLAWDTLHDEVMDGGFIQLIHNGYGSFIFKNPFAKAVKLWGLRELSKLIYDAHTLWLKHRDEIERDLTDDEFMALFEQLPEFDDLDDQFIESEEDWTKTIAHSQAYMQSGQPIYLSPVNKRRQVNFDEELMVIYFSILNYIHKEYGFPFNTECHYDIINDHQFKSYLRGMGKARLQQIKYKYFSDKALELWELCFAFFDEARQIVVNTKQKEYLLVKSFEIVFEDIIDELIGSRKNELPKELQEQPDGKQVDHMYRYKALTEASSENIYYIGDSKYYKSDTKIGKEALYKQFTYARNVVQWNLDLFLDDNRKDEQEVEAGKGTGKLRDEETEGYNIIPNFFISAQQRDLQKHSDITWVDKENKDFTSRQFHNRLFDRDTLLVCHYDVNFLYVVSLYGRKNEGMKAVWREKVRAQFRKEIQTMLDHHFQFHVMTPREHVDGQDVLQQNFKEVLGKVFQPYPTGINGQRFYSLALEKPETIKDERLKQTVIEENKRI